MKKSKIFAAVILLAMFSSLFTITQVGQPALNINTPAAEKPVDEVQLFTPNKQYLGANETYINDMDNDPITADGDLSDWAGYDGDTFSGIDLWYGYDNTNGKLYVAAQWADSSYDDYVGLWNKTGLDENGSVWEFLPGADDMFAFGISSEDAEWADVWVWTASVNRTATGLAYECNATDFSEADITDLPHLQNWEEDADGFGYIPLVDNSSAPLGTLETLANGTKYHAWLPNTPTDSQTDVTVGVDFNTTRVGYYTIEMIRDLDTGRVDDIIFDPTDLEDHQIWIGKANKQDCWDMSVGLTAYDIYDQNAAAYLQFSVIESPVEGESLVISGNASDDYAGLVLEVELSGWAGTYGAGTTDTIDINPVDGTWIYFFSYNKNDMPLGDHTVTVTLYPKYETEISLSHDVTIEDTTEPLIIAVTDVAATYPHGISINDTSLLDGLIEIACGTRDVYWGPEDLVVELYYYKDDDVALKVDMEQFASTVSDVFYANMTVEYEAGTPNNYTYFVSVWDGELNKVTSDYYYFWVTIDSAVVTTPGFGILIAIFGLAGASFILYRRFKK